MAKFTKDWIMSRVDIVPGPLDTPCWIWKHWRNHKGYGQGRVDCGDGVGSPMIHRASFKFFVRDLPREIQVHHKCEIKPCCNPEHLCAVTPTEHALLTDRSNMRSLNREKEYCKYGHEFTDENTLLKSHPNGSPHRFCKICIKRRNDYWNAVAKQKRKERWARA